MKVAAMACCSAGGCRGRSWKRGAAEGIHQRLGHHREAEPDAGKQHLAQRADIDDGPRAIEPLQGGEWTADIAELAVVIVLDDPAAGLGRPGQEIEPTRHAHDRTGRILVGGRDIGGPCRRGRRYAAADPQAMLVDRHRHQPRAGGCQRRAGGEIKDGLERLEVSPEAPATPKSQK